MLANNTFHFRQRFVPQASCEKSRCNCCCHPWMAHDLKFISSSYSQLQHFKTFPPPAGARKLCIEDLHHGTKTRRKAPQLPQTRAFWIYFNNAHYEHAVGSPPPPPPPLSLIHERIFSGSFMKVKAAEVCRSSAQTTKGKFPLVDVRWKRGI